MYMFDSHPWLRLDICGTPAGDQSSQQRATMHHVSSKGTSQVTKCNSPLKGCIWPLRLAATMFELVIPRKLVSNHAMWTGTSHLRETFLMSFSTEYNYHATIEDTLSRGTSRTLGFQCCRLALFAEKTFGTQSSPALHSTLHSIMAASVDFQPWHYIDEGTITVLADDSQIISGTV